MSSAFGLLPLLWLGFTNQKPKLSLDFSSFSADAAESQSIVFSWTHSHIQHHYTSSRITQLDLLASGRGTQPTLTHDLQHLLTRVSGLQIIMNHFTTQAQSNSQKPRIILVGKTLKNMKSNH